MPASPAQRSFDRYLRLLGVPKRKPGYDALSELVSAHLMRVPFENVSKLHRRNHSSSRRLPDLDEFLDGIEHNNFGGTCYTNNYYLNRLLSHLGYDVILCGADMQQPDVHIVSIVTLDGREFLVDTGYAAPFMHPLPRDLSEDYVIELGAERYVLHPRDQQGSSRMDHYRDGELIHGYTVKPIPRAIDYFNTAIADSFRDEATFMNCLHCVRFYPGRSVVISNQALIESEDQECRVTKLPSAETVRRAVVEEFGMPDSVVAEVVTSLPILNSTESDP